MQAAIWTPQPMLPPLSLEKSRPAGSPTPPFSSSPTLLCLPHIVNHQALGLGGVLLEVRGTRAWEEGGSESGGEQEKRG